MNTRMPKATPSNSKTARNFILMGAFVLVISACSPGSKPANAPTAMAPAAGKATVGAQTGNAAMPPAANAGRNVLSMNACKLFPGDAVAKALGTSLADPKNTGTGLGGPDCTYFLLPKGSGGGSGQIYILNLLVPKLFAPSKNGLVNAKPVAGLGDEAWLGTRVGTKTNDLLILKTGDISIEVLGDDAGQVQKLAEYVLSHL
jgi:hypothetical protein